MSPVRPVTRRLGAVVAVATLLLAAGCGGLDKDEKTAAGNLSRQFQDAGLTAADADCVSEKWVDEAGTKALTDDGILLKSLKANAKNTRKPSRSVVEKYVDAYFDCVDYGKLEAQKFEKSRPNIIDKDLFADCADEIDEDDARQAMVDDLLAKNTKTSTSVQHQLLQCATARKGN